MDGVGDEVAPGFGHALEPAEGFGGDAGEDLHERVVGEPGRHRRAGPLGAGHGTEGDLRSRGPSQRCE